MKTKSKLASLKKFNNEELNEKVLTDFKGGAIRLSEKEEFFNGDVPLSDFDGPDYWVLKNGYIKITRDYNTSDRDKKRLPELPF